MQYDSQVMLPKGRDECFGKNYLSFLDFTRNYKRTSGIFVPCVKTMNAIFCAISFNSIFYYI